MTEATCLWKSYRDRLSANIEVPAEAAPSNRETILGGVTGLSILEIILGGAEGISIIEIWSLRDGIGLR